MSGCTPTLRAILPFGSPLDTLVRWDLAALWHRDDDVSSLAAAINVAVRFDDVVQRIAPIDHRPDLAGCRQLAEQAKVLAKQLR
jgi:2-oxo-4-hydroxy-4-carboxy--5-ureidoimidazoline (OHCU) decarboxylase